jgi:uncharacterized protein YhaN
MRIRKLDLAAFGIFTGTVLDLPLGELDFYLIYGPNEAGKSTIRNAVANLLYGIGKTSRYSFLHPYPEMCIGAEIEADGKFLAFRRLKKNKNSLVSYSDQKPLPENALSPFLGNTDENFFQRMFALDHDGMVQGGRDILDSSSDLGQILFQAAAGLQTLQATREALETEADQLWGPRSKDGRVYTKAEKRLDEARVRLKTVQVTTQKWSAAKRSLDEAVELEGSAQERSSTLSAEREMLERVQRVAPHIAQYRDAQQELATLGNPVLLPEDATQTVAKAAATIIAAQAHSGVHQGRIDRDTEALSTVAPNHDILRHSDEILRLNKIVAHVREAERDIPKREGEIAQYEQRAQEAATKIGWSGLQSAQIEERVPATTRRAEIDALANRHAVLESEMTQRSRAAKEARILLEDLDGRLQAHPQLEMSASLAAALHQASTLADDERDDEISAEISAGERKLVAAVAALTPWQGDLQTLLGMQPPDDDTVRRALDERSKAVTARDEAERDLLNRRLALVTREAEFSQLERTHHPVTEDQIAAIRVVRDGTWQRIRSGEVTAAIAGDQFEGRTKDADALADRRYSEAENSTRAEALANQRDLLRAEISELEMQFRGRSDKIEHINSDWAAQMNVLGLTGVSLDRMPNWVKDRSAALDAFAMSQTFASRKKVFEDRARRYARELREQMELAGISGIAEATLKDLVGRAEQLQTAALRGRTMRETLERQVHDAKVRLHVAELDEAEAKNALELWRKAWDSEISASLLPTDIGVPGARAALEVFRQVEDAVGKIRSILRERIEPMQRDIREFEGSVATLVGHCAPDLSHDAATSAVDELGSRLETSQRDAAERIRLENDIQKTNGELTLARAQEAEANSELAPLKEMAGVTKLDHLQASITLSDRFRTIKRQADSHLTAAVTSGGGLAYAALEREVAAVDLAQLETRLAAVATSLTEARNQYNECIRQRALAFADYSKIAGTDDAAKAEALRQSALAQMAAAVEEYVRVEAGAQLLKWGLDRYREEKQGPLLTIAGEFFSTLTDGQHSKLLIEQDDTPRLLSKKSDGKTVGVEGMSDGTSDQLYLALRLAALEMHLQEGTPMPFIADDLLIKCDDARAASSFAALGRLARKTQVLYFTHHEHLIQIAQKATDNKVHIVRM